MARQAVAQPNLEARERLLRAAEKLFAEKGFAATSVQEIAEAATVNKALLYYYFEDKHSLYVSLIDDGVAEFERMLDGSLATEGPHPDRLEAFVRAHVDLLWNRGDLIRVVHRALIAGDHEELGLEQKFERCLGRLEAFIAEAVAEGAFRPVDPAMTARSLVGITDMFACSQIYHGKQHDAAAVVAHVTDLLLYGLRRD